MPKISYPFSAVPNQICRGGHGAINLAVLTTLLSHGKSSASAQTIANEIGCDRKSVFAAYKYWTENGPKNGVVIHSRKRNGLPTIYEVEVTRCEEPVPETEQVEETEAVPKTVQGCTGNGTPTRTENGTQRRTNQEEQLKDIYIAVENLLTPDLIGKYSPDLITRFKLHWNQEVIYRKQKMALWQKTKLESAFSVAGRLATFKLNQDKWERKPAYSSSDPKPQSREYSSNASGLKTLKEILEEKGVPFT